ncbi:methyltransferase (TIGR00027 family) [Rhodococcus sp. OK519]|uniref:class I SAM-dependent methyltransferase n=1 Tax=Rhodococcus sp. OK519 TaxID=2135729 RepID=UPI000D3BD521|nr:methyltransferase (TIGR00027 family) [Rhodococcus sp. OK519]
MSAAARAAHAIVDSPPHLIVDEIARRLCEAAGSPSPLDFHLAHPGEPVLAAARLSTAARSAYTERLLNASRSRQYVVLGAGLDTSAWRVPDSCNVWHVDLPGVLAWRSSLLADLHDRGTPVPVDLAASDPVPELLRAGLRPDAPVFVSWLGVSMYLDPDAVRRTFESLGSLAPGSELVFDHIVPPTDRDDRGAEYARAVGAAVGAQGEPWRCTPSRTALGDWLDTAGWSTVESVGESDSVPAGFWDRSDALQPMKLVRFTHARLSSPVGTRRNG